MLWLYIIVGILLLIPVLLQILLIGPVFQALIRATVGRFLSLGFRGPGFLMPFLHFRARRFRFMIHGRADTDRVFFSADRVRFRLDPFFLLLGKLRIVGLQLFNPYLEYFNRVESFEKNRYLPPRHRLELKNLSIHNGIVYVKDETMTPVYRLEIGRIELENCDMDVGTPVDLFFRAERGEASIGSGRIEIGNSSG
ncbi:MAG: hypothetical protein KDK34_00035, partial [Leptospiraceae bacterium]|nr:hypothetical protein [Leptospiraceae bacterium]